MKITVAKMANFATIISLWQKKITKTQKITAIPWGLGKKNCEKKKKQQKVTTIPSGLIFN